MFFNNFFLDFYTNIREETKNGSPEYERRVVIVSIICKHTAIFVEIRNKSICNGALVVFLFERLAELGDLLSEQPTKTFYIGLERTKRYISSNLY